MRRPAAASALTAPRHSDRCTTVHVTSATVSRSTTRDPFSSSRRAAAHRRARSCSAALSLGVARRPDRWPGLLLAGEAGHAGPAAVRDRGAAAGRHAGDQLPRRARRRHRDLGRRRRPGPGRPAGSTGSATWRTCGSAAPAPATSAGCCRPYPAWWRPGPRRPARSAAEAEAAAADATPRSRPRRWPSRPPTPPTDGWQLRALDPSGKKATPLDTFLSLMFVLASTKPDHAGPAGQDATRGGSARTGSGVRRSTCCSARPSRRSRCPPPPDAGRRSRPRRRPRAARRPRRDDRREPRREHRQPPARRATSEPGHRQPEPVAHRPADRPQRARRRDALLAGPERQAAPVRGAAARQHAPSASTSTAPNRPELNAVAAFGGNPITPREPNKAEATC